ncbi:CSC1-like protein HYP1 isoform X3 [Chenopodium quinoa]|uniref:CSC1-like protein HYP1 isoform X3 n=1 Tax=Chenopodium quinoa TaxID=63459 RepID=UPI000B77D247|nr:CSC1-like protein HYP1 isoform X3 [Chenopodium quinoa]
MILSALLTSVGINLGLCFLFFTLYSILRKQPSNLRVYAPRLVAERKLKQNTDFNLERLLPSAGWVKRAWQQSEEDLLEKSGLDGVVFMRLFTFSLKVFSVAAIIGVFILLPINFLGNQLLIDFSDLPNKSLDSFSISNVNNGSNRLWIHFCAAYVFTGAVCYLLYNDNAEKLYGAVDQLKSEERSSQRLGLFSNKDRHLRTLEKKLEVTEDNMRMEQSSLHEKEVPAAFVSFKSRYGAAIAIHIQQGVNPIEWVTEQAPEPDDVYWPFFSASYFRIWICKLVVYVASAVLTVLFLFFVLIVQGLTHLEQLESYLPFLKSILTIAFVSQVITGYLPSLILQLFLSFVPPIMKMLSSIQGYISMSAIQKSACNKVLWFTIWNIFFANVLSGTALTQVSVFFEPKKIPELLARGVPAQASFFISYVVTSGWTSLSSELFQLVTLIWNFLRRIFAKEEADDLIISSVPYESEIPRILFFVLLGITYFILAPLILPFLLVYFCMGYLIYRNQLLNVYAPKHETNGKFWPIVHNSTIFSLVLMHIIAIGIFGLKDLPLASSLIIPLPILTLLFNEYCRKRFLPIFQAYAAECLIKKDREEQNDPRMTEFLDKLIVAYQDPALKPSQYSRNTDSQTSPLLQSTEI